MPCLIPASMCFGCICRRGPPSPWAGWGSLPFPPVFTPMLAVPSATSSSELPGTAGWKRRCTGMLIISGPRQVFWVYPSFLKPPRPGNAAVLAQLLRFPGAAIPAPGLGSSDCSCPSHLIHLPGVGPELVSLGDAVHHIQLGAAEALALFDAGD